MIAAGIDFGATELTGAAAFDTQAIGTLFEPGSHALEVFGERGDAVAFLYAKLLRIADLDSLLRVRPEGREHRQFVNQKRHEFAGNQTAFQCRTLHNKVA